MKQTVALLIGLALAGSALTVAAQPGPGRGAGGPQRHGAQGFPPPIAAMLDTDSNGVLSAAEINQAPGQLLKLDANQDGQLTLDEVCAGGQNCPFGQQRQGRGARAEGEKPVWLRLFDADADGVLSGAEISNAPAALRALDKNQDSEITSNEIRPRTGGGRGPVWSRNR